MKINDFLVTNQLDTPCQGSDGLGVCMPSTHPQWASLCPGAAWRVSWSPHCAAYMLGSAPAVMDSQKSLLKLSSCCSLTSASAVQSQFFVSMSTWDTPVKITHSFDEDVWFYLVISWGSCRRGFWQGTGHGNAVNGKQKNVVWVICKAADTQWRDDFTGEEQIIWYTCCHD